jgi:hypothetical protein
MLRVLDHFWSPVVLCYSTEDAVRIVNSFYYNLHPHVTTITIISYGVTRLHNYNPYTPIFHSFIVSITHIHTSNKHSVHTLRNCFLPRTYCLAITLKSDSVSPRAFRISPLHGHPENGRYCCANRVTCVTNRCGATKYKHSSLSWLGSLRLSSAFVGSLRLSSALFGMARWKHDFCMV